LIAAREAGLKEVPVIVREASQQELVELALVENAQREDLNPLEAAEAYRQLAEDFGLSHEEIAARVGKSRVAVTNTLRLIKLPEDVRRALVEADISEGHARALLALPTPQAQSAALQTIRKNDLNVRQTEELVRKMLGDRPVKAPRPEPPAFLRSIEDRLRQRLGTRVSLNPGKKGGSLVIHYYSDEELDALVGLILGETDEHKV
jgi:ParB family chromosome partitioning protein